MAHNGLLSEEDREQAQSWGNELLEIIRGASESIASVTLEDQDREAIRESVRLNYYAYHSIGEHELLKELNSAHDYFGSRNGFVGKSHFVRELVGGRQGFDFQGVLTS